MVKYFITAKDYQTKKIGEFLAKEILKTKFKRTALILTLEGKLGSGKTTFIKGFAKGLGIKEKILSPTFLIIKQYKLTGRKYKNFFHIDCYRLKKSRELLDLGFENIIKNPKNIVALEWAEKVKKVLPEKNIIKIKLKYIDKNVRKIKFDNVCEKYIIKL